jgi:MtN3 and saliva related transmembrane protein
VLTLPSWLPVAIGIVAGALSTISFAPQVLKAWREGDTAAISRRMYIVTVVAFAMWIIYGVMIESVPIMIFNALSLVMSGSILVMKIRNGSKG